MTDIIKKIEYKDYILEIYQDYDNFNPRLEFDNLSKMVCFHNNYNLGDDHNLTLEEAIKLEKSRDIICLPLYMYDHSGLAFSSKPFSCRFDSGKLGFLYAYKKDIYKEYNVKRICKKLKEKIYNIFNDEINTYSKYINNEVYCYELRCKKDYSNLIDSCGGFYSIEEAIEHCDYINGL